MRALEPVILARTGGKKRRMNQGLLSQIQLEQSDLYCSPILEERWQCEELRRKCEAFGYCVRYSFRSTAAQEAIEPWGILQHLVLCAIRGDAGFLLFTSGPQMHITQPFERAGKALRLHCNTRTCHLPLARTSSAAEHVSHQSPID